MSAFRHCCRHPRQPRAASPDLPPANPVPSPTQDDGYDADAVPIPTPTETLVGSLSPSTEEPRPSSDTVIYCEPVRRSSVKTGEENNDGDGIHKGSELLRPERMNSLNIPRRKAHARSQPTLSTSAAAAVSDQYISMSPSRIALRKRLEAVKIIDEPNALPSSGVESTQGGTSIAESVAVPSHWRLDYIKSSSSFQRSGLREVSVNEHEKEGATEESQASTSTKATAGSTEVHADSTHKQPPISFENERLTGSRVLSAADAVETQNLPKQRTGNHIMPGSYQSDSTAASVHLYDMMISQRVASSNSNISPYRELNMRRQRASTAGSSSPSLTVGKANHQRGKESSSLRSPKPSSSVYASSEEELASSRRNSMLLIEGLPERLRRLKFSATSGDLYSTSAQHSLITIVPRSRFPTTRSDESKKRGSNSGEVHGNEAAPEGEFLDEEAQASPSLRRSFTEPKLNRFKRGAPASFDGSGEWHLSPPSRQPTGLFVRQPTGLMVRQPTGLGVRRPTGTLSSEDAASAWERALRVHAQEDTATSRARLGSISHMIGRDDFKRRVRSRQFTRTPSPLGNITEDPWSQQRGREFEPASGRVSPTGGVPEDVSMPRQISPNRDIHELNIARSPTGSARSVESWTRFPSHTLAERAGAANERDNVISRDFAVTAPLPRRMSKKKTRSMTFGRRFLHKIGRLYTARSSDIRRYNAGHRSSITVGGRLENPELEIPRRTFEPVFLSGTRSDEEPRATDEPQSGPEGDTVMSLKSSSPELHSEQGLGSGVESPGSDLSPVDWGRFYHGLVVRPRNTSTDDEVAPDEIVTEKAADVERDRAGEAEVDAVREMALRAADECVKRSLDVERV
ncbi:MAG: hypothetical protein Q9182_003649 [Xanthomendoza sp. 2 TL-2023]